MALLGSLAAILVLVSGSLAGTLKLPPHFPRCCREDPKISECLLKATDTVREDLIKGLPKYGIFSISPLKVPEIKIEQTTDSLDVKIVIKEAIVKGLETYEFSDFNYDPKNITISGRFKVGSIDIQGMCDFDGRVLLAQLNGTGKFSAVSNPTEGWFEMYGEIKKEKDIEYLQLVDGKADVTVVSGTVALENFVGDNAELVDAMNDVLKHNSKRLIKELRGPVEQLLRSTILETVNNLAKNVPYDEVFPHCPEAK